MPIDRPISNVAEAARRLRNGGLVAFGTETVYGLGAAALDERAVARVFEVKDRPSFDPLIVHLADPARLDDIVDFVPPEAAALVEGCWPGPLTVVLPRRDVVPDLVSAGLSTVAVRVPDHGPTLELLRAADVPVAAPSANRFGGLSPTSAHDVIEQLGERLDTDRDAVLDLGPCRVGVESTVVGFPEGRPTLLRPGGLPLEAIREIVGTVVIPPAAEHPVARAMPGPGMLPRHYAPRTPVILEGEGDPPDGRLGLLTLVEPANVSGFDIVEALSPTGDLAEAATGFFAAMRRLDACGLDVIVARLFPEHGLGRALNDRLRRAAATFTD